jgi:hypothetical protein
MQAHPRPGKPYRQEYLPGEAGVADRKHYAPGIGMIREEAVEGETSRLDLIERSRS